MIVKNYLDYMNLINEGLIKTYDGEKSITYLVDTLQKLGFNISGILHNNIIKLEIKDFNYIDSSKLDNLFDTISSIMTNKFGWFPSSMLILLTTGLKRNKKYSENEIKSKKKVISNLTIDFESKFDNSEIFSGKLYHLSIQEYNKKIIKKGLSPRSKSKLSSHLDRIYVCKEIDEVRNLIPSMKLHYSEERDINFYELNNKKWRKNTNWIIYELKVNNIKLYDDPRYLNGYYTMDNISPSDISVVDEEYV